MDKKLIDCFTNLSKAIEELSKILNETKNSKTSSGSSIKESLKSLDISEQLKSIDDGVKKIKNDNKEIVKNQKSILLAISKQERGQKKPTEYEYLSSILDKDKKKQINLKDGVKMIMLMAGGILAIGLAFKVIGNVNLKSVLAISLALPLIAFAFEKVSKIKTTVKDMTIANLGLVMMAVSIVAVSKILQFVSTLSASKMFTTLFLSVAFIGMSVSIVKITDKIKSIDTKNLWKLPLIFIAASAAITFSSWILQYVRPMRLSQLLTVVLISTAFAIISVSIDKIARGVKNVDVKNLWKLPLVLLAASAAISLSSYVLQKVKPVGFSQLITTIFIAAAFAVISYGLNKIVTAINNIKRPEFVAISMPIILVALSAAIAGSSYLLSMVKPMSLIQALTTVLIAATFVILSYGLPKLVESIGKVSTGKALLMPLILTALSAAITLSSYILSKVKTIPLPTLINIIEQAIVLSLVGIAFGTIIFLFDKMKITLGKAVEGGLTLIALSAAIMASSMLISNGNYTNAPNLLWTLDTAVSLLAFGILSFFAGPETETIIEGSLALLAIASTVMASSLILSIGNYANYPGLQWTLGVAASMLAFGVAMGVLGVISITGVGALALLAGAVAVLGIAGTIVGTAAILNSGVYGVYPSLAWASGVGLSLLEFGTAMTISGPLFPLLAIGRLAIPMIANSIVDTAAILSNGKFIGGPSLSWAIGTGLLMTTFGASMLALGAFIGGTLGVGYLALKAGSHAIKLVAQSIVDAAAILSTGKFVGGPDEKWSEGVGLAISAFAPVYSSLSGQGIFSIFSGGSSAADMSNAIRTISQGIVDAAIFFNNNSVAFEGGPSKSWSEGVGTAISAFAPVIANLNKGGIFSLFTGGLNTEDMNSAIVGISKSIVASAGIFSGVTFEGGPTSEWVDGVGKSITTFAPIIDNLDKGGIFGLFKGGLSSDDMVGAVIGISSAISSSSLILAKGNYKPIPTDYISSLSSNVKEIVNLTQYLNGINTGEHLLEV